MSEYEGVLALGALVGVKDAGDYAWMSVERAASLRAGSASQVFARSRTCLETEALVKVVEPAREPDMPSRRVWGRELPGGFVSVRLRDENWRRGSELPSATARSSSLPPWMTALGRGSSQTQSSSSANGRIEV
ncbi:MAG: hypothetical protein WD670_00670, partial [Actinomycetota bacterium]